METFFLLIVLTQNGAGDINASFVNTQTMQQCQQKALMVKRIFSASSIPVIENRCIKSALQFSEFSHASSSIKIKNFYLIHLDKENVDIKKKSDRHTCMEQKESGVKQGRIYCSSSVQSIKN